MKKLLYTDEPNVKSGYDIDARRHIKALLFILGACFILTVLVAAFAGIGG